MFTVVREIEKNRWQSWRKQHSASFESSDFLSLVASRIDQILSEAANYVPNQIELLPLKCPGCSGAMQAGDFEELVVVCPHCRAIAGEGAREITEISVWHVEDE